MDTWPFSLILPEDLAHQTERKKSLLQSITAAFLAFTFAERITDDEGTTDHMH